MARNVIVGMLLVMGGVFERPAWALPILDCERPAISRDGPFFAAPGPKEKSTQVYRWIWPTRADKVWEKPEWHCDGHISDDGEYLVAGDDWSGQISRDYKWDQVMLRFYHRDKLIRAVPLREVLLDPNKVAWNDCSSMWAVSMGFIGQHRFAVDTADDRTLVYDVTTGTLVEVRPSTAYEERHPGIRGAATDDQKQRQGGTSVPPPPPPGRTKKGK